MQDEDRLNAAERELAAALGRLRPMPTPMNRDHVMFQAGRMSGRRQNRVWQGISVSLAVLVVVAALWRPLPTARNVPPTLVANATPAVSPADTPIPPVDGTQFKPFMDYVSMRQTVVQQGADALPASRPARAGASQPPLTKERLYRILSSS